MTEYRYCIEGDGDYFDSIEALYADLKADKYITETDFPIPVEKWSTIRSGEHCLPHISDVITEIKDRAAWCCEGIDGLEEAWEHALEDADIGEALQGVLEMIKHRVDFLVPHEKVALVSLNADGTQAGEKAL